MADRGLVGGDRLTPACAGSTRRRAAPCSPSPTYPRVCGEHSQQAWNVWAMIDLPPRVRGALPGDSLDADLDRLTPACAGNTIAALLVVLIVATYPRVCGEHSICRATDPVDNDLPPRVRGALLSLQRARFPRRLTPACAGSTRCRRGSPGRSSTYPRVCGEHIPPSAAW